MVEYGPFIEYCCEVCPPLLLDIVVVVLAFMSLLVAASLLSSSLVKCHFCIHKKRTSPFSGTSFSREADAHRRRPTARKYAVTTRK